MPIDPFAVLYPEDINLLPIAWDHVHIPGPPAAYRLSPDERCSNDNSIRFKRRTIQRFDLHSTGAGGHAQLDHLAFIDKVSPHSLYDLMCTEVSNPLKATVGDIGRETGEAMCRSAYNFVDFVSRPDIIESFGLQNGELHLGVNCDPNTLDRESIQASKQFHMHFLYWTEEELAPLQCAEITVCSAPEILLRKRFLDPLLYLGAALVEERLRQSNFSADGLQLLPVNAASSIHKGLALGCLLRLDEWSVLNAPGFVEAIETIHRCMQTSSEELLAAFTGHTDTPAIWERHPLLPHRKIVDNIGRMGFSGALDSRLRYLASELRDLSAQNIDYLKRHKAARLRHMTLNNPCYAINLYAPRHNQLDQPLIEAQEIYLSVQVKLFSAIGGSGLVPLRGFPCVRIVRGSGEFSETKWRKRARFQREFATYNYTMIKDSFDMEHLVDYKFIDPLLGWSNSDVARSKTLL